MYYAVNTSCNSHLPIQTSSTTAKVEDPNSLHTRSTGTFRLWSSLPKDCQKGSQKQPIYGEQVCQQLLSTNDTRTFGLGFF